MMKNRRCRSRFSSDSARLKFLAAAGVIGIVLTVATRMIDEGQNENAKPSQTKALATEGRNLRFKVIAFEEIQRNDAGEETSRIWQVKSQDLPLPDQFSFAENDLLREENFQYNPPIGDYFLKNSF